MRKKLISKKKPFYPINELLKKYLISNNRWFEINILYNDLLRFKGSVVVYDKNNNDSKPVVSSGYNDGSTKLTLNKIDLSDCRN